MNALSQRHIRTTIVALLCGSLGSGCATFSRGSLIGTEDAVVRTRAEQRIGGTHDVDIQQTESTARIVGTRYCEDITTDTIRTTSYYTAENTNINRTRMTALTAAVIVGAGILLAIYPNVEPASEDMESSLDPGTARALGGGLIGAGALVSIVPLRDVVRANRPIVVTEERDSGSVLVASSVRCTQPVMSSNVAVEIRHPNGVTVPLGSTDASGTLVVELHRVVPTDWLAGSTSPRSLAIIVEGETVGHVDTAPLRARQDDAAFDDARLDVCAAAQSADACARARAYLATYPDGRHRVDVEPVVRAAQLRIDELRRQAEAQRAAELERQRLELERQRQIADELRRQAEAQRAAELERQRLELERQRQIADAERAAAQLADQRRSQMEMLAQERERERAQAAFEAEQQAAERRVQCASECSATCRGNRECVRECVRGSCR